MTKADEIIEYIRDWLDNNLGGDTNIKVDIQIRNKKERSNLSLERNT